MAELLARAGVRRIVEAERRSTRGAGGPLRPAVATVLAEAAGLRGDRLGLCGA